jgi:hypothetical protein
LLGRSVGENEPAWQRNFDDRLDSKGMFLFCSSARDFIMAELVTKQDLALALETQTLRLTVRVGAMLVVGLGALATILKLT